MSHRRQTSKPPQRKAKAASDQDDGKKRGSCNGNARAKEPGPGWFDRQTMAEMFDLKRPESFDRGPRQYAHAADITKHGRTVYFRAAPIIQRWAAATFGRADPDEAAMTCGEDSPALERWRQAKAKIAELDYLERQRELVNRREMLAALRHIPARLRDFGNRLQRTYGPQAVDMLNEALDEIEAEISKAGDDEDDQ